MVTKTSLHHRMTNLPRQKKLGTQQKNVHRRDSPRKTRKQQSTLTQIDFIQTPFSSRPDTVTILSDEEEDFQELRPRKKQKQSGRKLKKKQPDQSSLTQNWATHVLQPRHSLEIKDSEDEDDFDLCMNQVSPTGNEGTTTFKLRQYTPEADDKHAAPSAVKDAGRSRSEISQQLSRTIHFTSSSYGKMRRASPPTAGSEAGFEVSTPFTPRKTVVPSSVTPQSISKGLCSPSRRVDQLRSPLREQSVNVKSSSRPRPLKVRGPDDQDTGLVDLQNSEREGNGNFQVVSEAALKYVSQGTKRARPRRLKRATTIQDSEDDDIDLDTSPIASNLQSVSSQMQHDQHYVPTRIAGDVSCVGSRPAAPNSPQTLHEGVVLHHRTSETKFSAWKRTGVVQNSESSDQLPETKGTSALLLNSKVMQPILFLAEKSQTSSVRNEFQGGQPFDDAHQHDLDADIYTSSTDYHEGEDDDDAKKNELTCNGTQFLQTYDPAVAALERDAARFGKSETQLEQEDPSLDKKKRIDLAMALRRKSIPTEFAVDAERVPSSQSFDEKVPSSPVSEGNAMKDLTGSRRHSSAVANVDDSGYCSQGSTEDRDTVPSSQPTELLNRSNGLQPHSSQSKAREEERNFFRKPKKCSDTMETGNKENHMSSPIPHPSQISTVCDTQLEWKRSYLERDPRAQVASPTKHSICWPGTLPSSPVPLPPGVAARTSFWDESQIGNTADFSLPPPPLIQSSTKQTFDESEL